MTNYNGYPIWSATYLPFGYEVNPTSSVNHYKFTGLEHDSESELDHTWFRQYASTMARWMTPDPGGLAVVDPFNP
jgi:RHS repeat-associated protein